MIKYFFKLLGIAIFYFIIRMGLKLALNESDQVFEGLFSVGIESICFSIMLYYVSPYFRKKSSEDKVISS